jgi:hypothetical protein
MYINYYWIFLFCILYWLILNDTSVAKAVFFVSRIVRNKFEMFKWIVIHHPKTPWARYSMHRRSMKLAEELMKEMNEKNNI